MGRIAEALKRAQEERARRQETESPQQESAARPSGDPLASQNRMKGSGDKDVLASAKLLEVPSMSPSTALMAPSVLKQNLAPELIAYHDPNHTISEKYRSTRTRLMTGNVEYRPRIFAVSSAMPGEGKTITTANMGFSFAELKHLRVAVLDLDFRNRGLTRLFKVEDQPGIAEILRGEATLAQVCLSAVRPNLHLIPTGRLDSENPTDLLTGGRASALSKELRERFHYSLLDTPPISTVADIGLIAPLAHSVIMVIRMNKTPEPVIAHSVKSLQANNVAIAGGILVGDLKSMAAYDLQSENDAQF